MPSYGAGFNRILEDMARRQLIMDFQFGSAGSSYEAVRSIGAGAFGIVCEAIDSSAQERVMVMLQNQRFLGGHKEDRARFGHSDPIPKDVKRDSRASLHTPPEHRPSS